MRYWKICSRILRNWERLTQNRSFGIVATLELVTTAETLLLWLLLQSRYTGSAIFLLLLFRKRNNKVWLKPANINTPSSTQYYYLLLRPPNSVVINSPAHLQECSLLRSTSRSKPGKNNIHPCYSTTLPPLLSIRIRPSIISLLLSWDVCGGWHNVLFVVLT